MLPWPSFSYPEVEAIFRGRIGWMHVHFVGVRWKCFRLFWDSLWSAAAMAAAQLWSAFLADVCVRTFTPGSLSQCLGVNPSCINIIHARYNWYTCMLAWCVHVRLHISFVCTPVARLLCVFSGEFLKHLVVSVYSTVCGVCSTVCGVCSSPWCNIVFKNTNTGKCLVESTNVQFQFGIIFKCICKKDLLVFFLQGGNSACG